MITATQRLLSPLGYKCDPPSKDNECHIYIFIAVTVCEMLHGVSSDNQGPKAAYKFIQQLLFYLLNLHQGHLYSTVQCQYVDVLICPKIVSELYLNNVTDINYLYQTASED